MTLMAIKAFITSKNLVEIFYNAINIMQLCKMYAKLFMMALLNRYVFILVRP